MPSNLPFVRGIFQPSLSVADLLLRSGEQQADAERRRGEIAAQMWTGLGNTIARVPMQIQDMKTQAIANEGLKTRNAMQANALADQNDLRSGQATVDRMMSPQPLPAGAQGPQEETFLTPDGLNDIPKMNAWLSSAGKSHLAPELLKGAEQINESIKKSQEQDRIASEHKAMLYGDTAHGAITLGKALGIPFPDSMDIAVKPLLASKQLKPEEYAPLRQQIASLPPDQQEAALNTFRDNAAKLDKAKTVGKDTLEVDRYGRTIASNILPDKPNETEVALKAAGGDPVKAMAILKPGAKPSIEDEWVARDKRLAVAQNGGQPLTDAQEKDVTAKSLASYAVAKADPAMRDAALATKALAAAQAQANMNLQPTKEQAADIANDLVNHRLSPSQVVSLFSTRGKEGLAFKLAVTSEAKKIDPNFNFEEAQSNYDLAKSPGFQNTVRYMDSTVESIPRLLQNVNKLGRGDFRSWNQVANAAANQFNSTDLKRVKTDALLVGDEIAKILTGGGTGSATSDAKLKQASDLINTSDSVPAIGAAMSEVEALLGNRRKSLTKGTYMEGSSVVKPGRELIWNDDHTQLVPKK